MRNRPYPRFASTGFRLFAVLLLFALTKQLAAQELKVVQDLQLWTGVAIEKEIGKNWTFSLEEQIRFKHNISEINNYFTEAGVRYRINKNFALEGAYRYTRDRKSDNSYENLSRYHLDLRYRGRLDFITLAYRLRYQKEVEGFKLYDQMIPYEKFLRHRLKISYTDFTKLTPFVSGEIFQLFRPDYHAEYAYIRVQGGVRYDTRKLGSFRFAYGFNREINEIEPALTFLIKVNYIFQF